ncbi:hypothetical protein GUJ93_ZPchr0003g16939 [Zizania palustris]|uniref:Uncharacterized protein n=1 Tax=Zizania palustris TaxID=103762 RepID=A0A8J5VY87_ZIZPA|nr:hypothetical protein GUJ93_ZPchr0003g16939 [Zizania palustris]
MDAITAIGPPLLPAPTPHHPREFSRAIGAFSRREFAGAARHHHVVVAGFRPHRKPPNLVAKHQPLASYRRRRPVRLRPKDLEYYTNKEFANLRRTSRILKDSSESEPPLHTY